MRFDLHNPSATLSQPKLTGGRLRTACHKIRGNWGQLLRDGMIVGAFSLLIALVLWAQGSGTPFSTHLSYSGSIGVVTWLLIDIGRFVVDQDSPHDFPRGLKGVALIGIGVTAGFIIGTMLGDCFTGRNTWQLLDHSVDRFVFTTLVSLLIGISISIFFYLRGSVAHLHAEIAVQQRQSTDTKLKLLQSQLDSHMLFNTMANLRSLIPQDPQRAMQMVDQLCKLLRLTLSASRAQEHSLQDEFDRLRDYLSLMQVRLGQRLTFALELPAELAQVQVPTLILQSIVENAILHGLEPKVGGGTVNISASAHDAVLVLAVKDDGLGYRGTASPLSGFGLNQVKERLVTRYGARGTIECMALDLDSDRGEGGFHVQISMPLVSAAATHQVQAA